MTAPPGNAAVLFDLDGTLIDTAPDMVGALNALLAEHGRAPMPMKALRQHVSTGSAGLVRQGFGELPDEQRRRLVLRFLSLYDARVAQASHLFVGMDALLVALENAGVRWGIVTNKPGWLTQPLLDALGLTARCAALVCGDTLATRKPDPAPLLHAARLANADPAACVYVGDDERDIEAGKAAGMRTVAAAYGYIADEHGTAPWGADIDVTDIDALFAYLTSTVLDA